ncbi:MAG TPA: PQQ-dependent sugar dehydrogenase, partial [Phycisphaerae bacterium]|nr:PQQ-dependent sugar dehydrogenase [Phycisphaerae bacterium]
MIIPTASPGHFRAAAKQALLALAILTHSGVRIEASDALPAGFEVSTYLSGLDDPLAMAFDPDGRLFIAEKSGKVRIAMHGELRDEPVLDFEPYTFFENGLLGMALDPEYLDTPYLYLFATVAPDEQQIIRFRIVNGTGVEPLVIRDHIPTGGTIHNGGCLRFGMDGMLHFSVGDNGTSENAQDPNTLAGKLCRIHPDGSTPDDNSFTTPTGGASAVFARGFRNPFRFCFAPDGRLFTTDVGSFGSPRREEINLVRAGSNHGWPLREGGWQDGDSDGFVAPIFDYAEEGSCAAGIVYYDSDHFPAEYRGNLFQLDYTLSKIFRVTLDGDRVASHTLFMQADGNTVDIIQGPDGRLYYCELAGGRVMRIGYALNQTLEPGDDLTEEDWGGDEPDDAGNTNDNA